MTRYYRRLKTGEGRADALAAVQAEFRNGTAGNGQWKEPYHWAAWQLVGDWRPVQGL
jgi:CHAT domain-containing protein